jgi:hypothetical protein
MMKSKDVIFTIVAKNYFSLAATLRKSVFETDPEIDFKIFVVDDLNDASKEYTIPDAEIIICRDVLKLDFLSMAFKYDITEFNTAVKPFCFEYLKSQGYQKGIYFDPDIFVYNSLSTSVLSEIGDKLILLTPHYTTVENNYTGAIPEGMILWAGIVNLGFCCINLLHNKSTELLSWWGSRLKDACYADKLSGLHTDQKWIDFVPYYYRDEVVISHGLGYNASIWNLHERKFHQDENTKEIQVSNRISDEGVCPLVFFHFSGFDPSDSLGIHKHHKAYLIEDFEDIRCMINDYRKSLLNSDFHITTKWAYSFNMFSNGFSITKFHRRLYRRLIEIGHVFDNPFSTSDEYYQMLKSNQLLSKTNTTDSTNSRNYDKYKFQLRLFYFLLRALKKILGFDRYTMFLKLVGLLARPENQLFLFKSLDTPEFLNENSRMKK